jgi:hypothetical protein
MTTRKAHKLEIKLAQSTFISHVAALGGKAKQLFSDNLSYQKMKISYEKTKTFFDKLQNCQENRKKMEETTDQLLTELLCRTPKLTETDAVRLASILNLITNKDNEAYYISLPSSYVDERVQNANNALIVAAQLNIAGRAVADTLSILTDGTKKDAEDLTNLLLQTVVTGVSTISSIKFSGKLYKHFYDSLEPSQRKDLSNLFANLLSKPNAEDTRVFRALATSPGPVRLEPSDIETILECTEMVSSILSLPVEYEKKDIKKRLKLAHNNNLTKKITTFLKKPFNRTMKRPLAEKKSNSESIEP